MLTVSEATKRVEAAKQTHDSALIDRACGAISEREYQRACVTLEDAKLDLASAEARQAATPYKAIIPGRGMVS